MSKKLNTTPFGVVYDEDTKTFVKLDDKNESSPVEEDSLDITDDAHAEEQAESVVDEEKTLAEKEAEYKEKMGQEFSGESDLEKEERNKKVEVDNSLEEFEKARAQVRQKRINQNVRDIEKTSGDQVKRMQNLRADYIGRGKRLEYQGNVDKQHKLAQDYMREQDAVMNQANSMSNLVSMSINDALMNGGKDDLYAEDHVGEKHGLFKQESYGKQKSIIVNGAVVTVDKDVAEAVQKKRSPLLRGSKKLSVDGKVDGDSFDEIDDNADELLDKVSSPDLTSAEMSDVETDIDNKVDVAKEDLRKKRPNDMPHSVQEEELEDSDVESIDGHENGAKDNTGKVAAAGVALVGAKDVYENSRFAQMERNLMKDRADMRGALIQTRAKDYERQTEINHEYDVQMESQAEKQQERPLPTVAWNYVITPDYEADGRRLPYIDYGDANQPQDQMSM